jgi:hypothetical protein
VWDIRHGDGPWVLWMSRQAAGACAVLVRVVLLSLSVV